MYSSNTLSRGGESPSRIVGDAPGCVEVLWDYIAQYQTELTIHKGDIIREVVENSNGWWSGKLNGRLGIFPCNYTKRLYSFHMSVVAVEDYYGSGGQVPFKELTFSAGEPFIVDDKDIETGLWWHGVIVRGGQFVSGWFPCQYVKEVNTGINALARSAGKKEQTVGTSKTTSTSTVQKEPRTSDAIGHVNVYIVSASNLTKKPTTKLNPQAHVGVLEGKKLRSIFKTAMCIKTCSPVWEERFQLNVRQLGKSELSIAIRSGKDSLGLLNFPIDESLGGGFSEQEKKTGKTFKLTGKHAVGTINVVVSYESYTSKPTAFKNEGHMGFDSTAGISWDKILEMSGVTAEDLKDPKTLAAVQQVLNLYQQQKAGGGALPQQQPPPQKIPQQPQPLRQQPAFVVPTNGLRGSRHVPKPKVGGGVVPSRPTTAPPEYVPQLPTNLAQTARPTPAPPTTPPPQHQPRVQQPQQPQQRPPPPSTPPPDSTIIRQQRPPPPSTPPPDSAIRIATPPSTRPTTPSPGSNPPPRPTSAPPAYNPEPPARNKSILKMSGPRYSEEEKRRKAERERQERERRAREEEEERERLERELQEEEERAKLAAEERERLENEERIRWERQLEEDMIASLPTAPSPPQPPLPPRVEETNHDGDEPSEEMNPFMKQLMEQRAKIQREAEEKSLRDSAEAERALPEVKSVEEAASIAEMIRNVMTTRNLAFRDDEDEEEDNEEWF